MHHSITPLFQYSNLQLIVRKLALMRQRQSQILQSQTGIDRNDPQRLRARVEVLVLLEDRNRENVERVEFVLLVRDDNFAAPADDQVDFVVEVTMGSRAFAGRDLSHHDAKRLALKADARVYYIGHATHRRWLKDEILLFDQHFTFPS